MSGSLCTLNCDSLQTFPVRYLGIFKIASTILYGISNRQLINGITQETGGFHVFSSNGTRVSWRKQTSTVIASFIASEVESANVVNHFGQQYVIIWSQTVVQQMIVETCISSFSFDGISFIPTKDDLGTVNCSSGIYYGLSVVSIHELSLLFVSYPSKVHVFCLFDDHRIPDVIQHPQLRFLASITQSSVKNVLAMDVSNSVSAFLMIQGSFKYALEYLMYAPLPANSPILSSNLLLAHHIRPLTFSSKPHPVILSVQQSLVLKLNSSVLDVYGLGFDSSSSLFCGPSFSFGSIMIECSLTPVAARFTLNSVFISSQQLSLRGGRWISNQSTSIVVSIPLSLQSNYPRQLLTNVKPAIFSFFPSSGSSLGGYVVTVTGLGFLSLQSPKCSFGNMNSVSALQVSDTEIVCPIRPSLFSGRALEILVISGMQSAGPFEVLFGLYREIDGVTALNPASTTHFRFLASSPSAINSLVISPVSNSSNVLATVSTFVLSPFVISVSISGLMQSLRAITNESLRFSLKTSDASLLKSSAIVMQQTQMYLASPSVVCFPPASAIQVVYGTSALENSLGFIVLPNKEPSPAIPKFTFHPGASSIRVQVSTSSVIPSVCYLDTHRSGSSVSFDQSYPFSMGPEVTFDGSIQSLSVKYWNVLIHQATAQTGQSFQLSFTLRHQCPGVGCNEHSCPPLVDISSGRHFFASDQCNGLWSTVNDFYPATHLHVSGSFTFLNFSVYASNDNKSWVLIDARSGDFEYHSLHGGWGLVPIPFVVDPSSNFTLGLIPGVHALVPLKFGDSNFRFKIGEANVDPNTCTPAQNCGSPLDSSWSLSMWIKPESCRSPCMPIILLTNVHGKRGAQGQSWVTLELFSVLKDDRTAAFSFSLCLWINSSFSICSKSADQIYPSTFSQFVITYSEGSSNFDVHMYANRAEVLFHRGSLHIPLQPQQRGFGQVIVGLGYNGYVDDILLWLEPVQDSLEEIFGTIGSESLVFGIAFGSELLLSNIHQRALESVKYEGFAYFMGPGFTPFEDDDENVIRFGFAPSSITLNFRGISAQQLALQTPPGQPSLHHSALSSDYYGSRKFSFSSTAAPIFVGIEGNSSGVSCQSESIVSCSFDVSDVELLPSTFSSLRIFSQGTNAQFGLDVEIHSRIFGITPSTPTFETSEMLSVDVSGGHHNGV